MNRARRGLRVIIERVVFVWSRHMEPYFLVQCVVRECIKLIVFPVKFSFRQQGHRTHTHTQMALDYKRTFQRMRRVIC